MFSVKCEKTLSKTKEFILQDLWPESSRLKNVSRFAKAPRPPGSEIPVAFRDLKPSQICQTWGALMSWLDELPSLEEMERKFDQNWWKNNKKGRSEDDVFSIRNIDRVIGKNFWEHPSTCTLSTFTNSHWHAARVYPTTAGSSLPGDSQGRIAPFSRWCLKRPLKKGA